MNLENSAPSEIKEPKIDEIDDVKLIDIVFILFQWKKQVLGIIFSVMILTFLISWFMDKWYESTVVVLPPDKTASALDMITGGLGSIGSGILGIGDNGGERYVAILKSRRLREDLIRTYDLMAVFDKEHIEDMLKVLDKILTIETDKKTGTISIVFEFKNDPEKTAEMANFIVKRLDEINRDLSTEQARSTRIFIEKRYLQATVDLKNAEDSLNLFQNKFGVIEITEQTAASIKAAAELYAELVATEMELNVKKKTLGDHHPDILGVQSKLDELRKAQVKMEKGGGNSSIFIPFKETPDLALEYFRLFRNVQINNKILEFLFPQYEQAKIQEAKDTPTLLVLDNAHPATKHSHPKKVINTLLAGLVAFVILVMLIYIYENTKKNREFVENKKFIYLLESLRLRLFNK